MYIYICIYIYIYTHISINTYSVQAHIRYVCMYIHRRLGSNAQVAYCRRPQSLVDLSAIKGSPGWHRRERLRRSKARRRVHSARKAGRWPPSSALELLQQHTTKPQYRELAIPMGKRGGSGGRGRGHAYDGYSQAGWDYSGSSGHRQWNLWKGAWSPRHGRHSEERYDQVELKPQAHQSELGVSDGSLLSGIQRALTAAKKHDVRVRKLTEERQTRQKQFAQYTEDVKLKYAKQKKAFWRTWPGSTRSSEWPRKQDTWRPLKSRLWWQAAPRLLLPHLPSTERRLGRSSGRPRASYRSQLAFFEKPYLLQA